MLECFRIYFVEGAHRSVYATTSICSDQCSAMCSDRQQCPADKFCPKPAFFLVLLEAERLADELTTRLY